MSTRGVGEEKGECWRIRGVEEESGGGGGGWRDHSSKFSNASPHDIVRNSEFSLFLC